MALRRLLFDRSRAVPGTLPLVGALAGLSALSMAGTLLAPLLLRSNPLLLVVMSPRLPFLAVAATVTPWPVFVAVAGARLCLADPFHYRLGRNGSALAQRLLGTRRDWLRPLGPAAIVVSPTGRFLAASGAAGSPRRWVVLADIAGTGLRLGAILAVAA